VIAMKKPSDLKKPSVLRPGEAVFRHVIRAGDYWIDTLRRGQCLRIVDLEGNQAADTLFFNAADIADRYSAVDTIREQGNVYLSCGLEATLDFGPGIGRDRRRHGGPARYVGGSVRVRIEYRPLRAGKKDDAFVPRQLSPRAGAARFASASASAISPTTSTSS
jgi:hypothetical protein